MTARFAGLLLAALALAACQPRETARVADPSQAVLTKVSSYGNHPCNAQLSRVLAGFDVQAEQVTGVQWTTSRPQSTDQVIGYTVEVNRTPPLSTGRANFMSNCTPIDVYLVRTAN